MAQRVWKIGRWILGGYLLYLAVMTVWYVATAAIR